MVYPQIYIGHIPASAAERRALRAQALDLHAALRASRTPAPTYLLLNFVVDPAATPTLMAELLLLRPNVVIVGAIRSFSSPIEVTPDGYWTLLATGTPIREASGLTPLQVVRAQRDAVRARIEQEIEQLLGPEAGAQSFERIIGALICAPITHPESRISLDIGDHQRWLKILGLDELAGLAAMANTGTNLDEQAMRAIAAELFDGQLWHNGERFLFELAPGRLQLRLLGDDGHAERVLALAEGENIVGRRRQARPNELRVTIDGDDLISSDHARIIVGDDDCATLRDTSKNGTWVALPGEPEERIHGAERTIGPGTLLRMGVTRMRLERAGD